jgi:serine/threonine protein kinase
MRPEPRFTGTNRFQIIRQLGQGGMGVVYEALDRQRRMRVALKTLRRVEPHDLYQLKAEFRSLADLQHPNLVRLEELCCEEGDWFFTMELVHGTGFLSYVRGSAAGGESHDDPERVDRYLGDTLTGEERALASPAVGPSLRLPRHGQVTRRALQFDEDRLRGAMRQLVLAVSAIHEAGKLHRDIKPSNILVTTDDRVVLLDFGMVTGATPADQSQDGGMVGTVAYMAPEQAASQPVGPAADWYSVGVVLYQALCGQLPHEGSLLAILIGKQRHQPPPPGQLAPGVPRDLDELARDLLQRDPADRPNGDEVQARLGAATWSSRRRRSATMSRPLPFVGRGPELDRLQDAFDEILAGRHVSVLVTGESGVGKSALVRQFCDRLAASERNVLVLEGRCYEKESVPYKAFDGIVDALMRFILHLDTDQASALLPSDASHLGRLFPVLRRIPVVERLPDRQLIDPQQVRNRALAAFRDLLARVRQRMPLVLVIDDFQWADADSMALLGELLHAPPPMLLVMTARPARGATASDRDSTDGDGPVDALPASTWRVDLRTLAPHEAEELAERMIARAHGLGGVTPGDVAREAGGHPLFLLELVRHLELTGGEPGGDLHLDEALFARASRLPRDARSLLEVIAVAGEPVPQGQVAQAAGLEPGEAHGHLSLLRAASLVSSGAGGFDRIEAYHDRVREAMLEHMEADSRRAHHAAWARVLEATGEVPEALVRHLWAAGDGEGAAQRAVAAAGQAVKVLAFDQAARLYRIALDLGHPEKPQRRRLLVALGEALESGGRGREAAEAYLAAADGAEPSTRRTCQRRAAEQLLICGHIEQGLKVIEDLLGSVGTHLPRSASGALFTLLWERIRLRVRGFRWKERHENEIPPADLLRADIHRAVGVGLAMVDTVRGAAFQSRATRLTLRLGERKRICLALATEAGFVATSGDLAKVGRLVEPAAAIAASQSDPLLTAYMHAVRGVSTYLAGQFHRGYQECTRGLDVLIQQTVGTTFERNTLRYFQVASLMHMGQLTELRRLLADYLRDAWRRGDRYALTSLTRMVSHAWLTDDDPEAMRQRLSSTDWVPPAGVYHLQHFYDFRAATELDLYEGRIDPAGDGWRRPLWDLRRSGLMRIEIQRHETHWLLARLFLAQAAGGGGKRPLARAGRLARQLDRGRCPYTRSWAALVRAGVDSLRGRGPAAVGHLERARELAVANDQELVAACAAWRLGTRIEAAQGSSPSSAAGDWFARQGVANPERMCAVIAPGFRDRSV